MLTHANTQSLKKYISHALILGTPGGYNSLKYEYTKREENRQHGNPPARKEEIPQDGF